MKRYISIWVRLASMTSQQAFLSRSGALIFIIGKILRFTFFFLFLILLGSRTKVIVGYSLWQMIFFYVTFNVVDTSAQFFLREVYRFRSYIVSGTFDYTLSKPFSPLFRSLFGGSDLTDLLIFVVSILFVFIASKNLPHVNFFGVVEYIFLLLNAFVIALAFHITTLSLGVLTTEVDNTIMVYRDVTQMGRVPVDVYQNPLRSLITFAVPVGIMMTFPAKAFMGLLSPWFVILSLCLGGAFLYFSLRFWQFSLLRYSSASS